MGVSSHQLEVSVVTAPNPADARSDQIDGTAEAASREPHRAEVLTAGVELIDAGCVGALRCRMTDVQKKLTEVRFID
jgi:hypothetical protein